MREQKPMLSISLLISNRLDTIPRCLDSLKPIMDAIPSELILVDTSNNPEIYPLLCKYTDKIEKFQWCNDFAKARNVGLKKAVGEWFLFLDDDEWFVEYDALIDFFVSGEYKQYDIANYKVRNFINVKMDQYSDSWATRMIKMDKDVEFRSKIHEYLYPTNGAYKNLEAMVNHTGYIYETKEKKELHFQRNASLLEQMIEEEPNEFRWRVQLAQEYQTMNKWEEMEECALSAMELLEKGVKTEIQKIHQIHIMTSFALYMNKKYIKTKEICKQGLQIYYKITEASGLYYYYQSLADYNLKDYEQSLRNMMEYKKCYEKSIHEKKTVDNVGVYFSDAFADGKVKCMYAMLINCELKQGKNEALEKYLTKLGWEDSYPDNMFHLAENILEYLMEQWDEELLRKVLIEAYKSEKISYLIMITLEKSKEKTPNAYYKVLSVLSQLPIQSWYKEYAFIFTASENESKENLIKAGYDLIMQLKVMYKVPEEAIEELNKRGIELGEIYQQVDFNTWKNQLVQSIKKSSWGDIVSLKEQLEKSCLTEDIRYYYFMMLYCINLIVRNVDNKDMHVDEYSKMFGDYSDYTCKCYEILYGPKLQMLEPENLPNEYKTAMWIRIYFEELEVNLSSALQCLGKVAQSKELFQEPIKFYLKLIQNEVLNG